MQLSAWPLELKIGILVTSMLGNVHANFVNYVFSFLSLKPIGDGRTDGGQARPVLWPIKTATG